MGGELTARRAPAFAGPLADFAALAPVRECGGRVCLTPRGRPVSGEALATLW